MKTLLVLSAIFGLISTAAFADQVSGYTRSNGTYVQPYERSHADNTVTNNYSYSGNTNPSTGTVGTNSYQHDVTSPNYTGPDRNGNVGHANNAFGGYGNNR